MESQQIKLHLVVLATLSLVAAGCQSPKVLPENYKKYPVAEVGGKKVRLVPAWEVLMEKAVPVPPAPSCRGTAILVNTHHQRAWLYQNGIHVETTPTCTGKPGYETPSGTYQVISKHRHWVSTIYGVPMPYFLRLNCAGGRIGLHQGNVLMNPASHGCIRLPEAKASAFFEATPVGSTVVVESTQLNSAM